MSLNRFFLTQDGWVPEGPISAAAHAWLDGLARDVLTSHGPTRDEGATSPPLANVAASSRAFLPAR